MSCLLIWKEAKVNYIYMHIDVEVVSVQFQKCRLGYCKKLLFLKKPSNITFFFVFLKVSLWKFGVILCVVCVNHQNWGNVHYIL